MAIPASGRDPARTTASSRVLRLAGPCWLPQSGLIFRCVIIRLATIGGTQPFGGARYVRIRILLARTHLLVSLRLLSQPGPCFGQGQNSGSLLWIGEEARNGHAFTRVAPITISRRHPMEPLLLNAPSSAICGPNAPLGLVRHPHNVPSADLFRKDGQRQAKALALCLTRHPGGME